MPARPAKKRQGASKWGPKPKGTPTVSSSVVYDLKYGKPEKMSLELARLKRGATTQVKIFDFGAQGLKKSGKKEVEFWKNARRQRIRHLEQVERHREDWHKYRRIVGDSKGHGKKVAPEHVPELRRLIRKFGHPSQHY